MKSEHLAEAKRNLRGWPLLTIINYNDTATAAATTRTATTATTTTIILMRDD